MNTRFEIQHLEAKRFLLTSLANPQNVHLVDLDEYDGYGECSCEYFTFKIRPAVKERKKTAKTMQTFTLSKDINSPEFTFPRVIGLTGTKGHGKDNFCKSHRWADSEFINANKEDARAYHSEALHLRGERKTDTKLS